MPRREVRSYHSVNIHIMSDRNSDLEPCLFISDGDPLDGGAAVRPVSPIDPLRDADATAAPQLFRPQADVVRRHGANLPHWHQAGATYYVTFRLADSLPAQVLEAWHAEREELRAAARAGDDRAVRQLPRLATEQMEQRLDKGAGECLLAKPSCASIVAAALSHFDEHRYRLWAWCIMPNHVHALVEPAEGYDLSSILHTWKSYTAHALNRALGRHGPVWQAETFDHLVRQADAFERQLAYILANPEQAGLIDWIWRGSRGGLSIPSDSPPGCVLD